MPTVKKRKPIKRSTRSRKPARKSIASRIQPLTCEGQGLKLNIYGRSGTGKTTFWATFPKPILALIASGGKHPGELWSINTPEYRKTVKQLFLEDPQDVLDAVAYQEEANFSTVVLDHATGLQDLVLRQILNIEEVPEQKTWGLASQQQWGQCTAQTKELLRALLSLTCNVVIVAQERDFNTDTENDLLMPYVASALTPSLVGWLNPACNYIVNTFIRQKMLTKKYKIKGKTKTKQVPTKGVQYCMRIAPNAVFTTKFRAPKGHQLPDIIVDPDYDKVLKLIQGKV